MVIWAWLGAAAVGLSLGLLGSGGAILTVPILVYLVGHDEKSAIAESLAIVGAIAVAGVVRASMQKRVDFRSAALLAFPGIVGTYLGASAAEFISGAAQLVLLAGLMLAASALMFRNGSARAERKDSEPHAVGPILPGCDTKKRCSLWMIAVQGVGLGLATGLVGVGGGFLIVPVLVLLRRLPMPTAIGTSLAIIAVNSATAFLQYLAVFAESADAPGQPTRVDWAIIGVFAAVGIAGSLVGNFLAGRIYQDTLKRIFAVFLVIMAGYILVRQAPRVLPGVFGETPAATHSTP
jgi:uncharacterized membrane protein YfcA